MSSNASTQEIVSKKATSRLSHSKKKTTPGPKADRLKLNGNWKDLVKKSLSKKKPPKVGPSKTVTMTDPEILRLLNKAQELKVMSERLIEWSRKLQEEADRLIAESKKNLGKPKLA